MKIRSVDARYGGASHDSHIWSLSSEREILSRNWMNGDKCWILGDSGYPLEPWLITPYRSVAENSHEATFNTKHSSKRNIIERTYGVLKGRFRCLLKARELHYSPRKVTKMINVCSMLHNVCIHYNVELDEDLVSPSDGDAAINFNLDNTANLDSGTLQEKAKRIRNQLRDSII